MGRFTTNTRVLTPHTLPTFTSYQQLFGRLWEAYRDDAERQRRIKPDYVASRTSPRWIMKLFTFFRTNNYKHYFSVGSSVYLRVKGIVIARAIIQVCNDIYRQHMANTLFIARMIHFIPALSRVSSPSVESEDEFLAYPSHWFHYKNWVLPAGSPRVAYQLMASLSSTSINREKCQTYVIPYYRTEWDHYVRGITCSTSSEKHDDLASANTHTVQSIPTGSDIPVFIGTHTVQPIPTGSDIPVFIGTHTVQPIPTGSDIPVFADACETIRTLEANQLAECLFDGLVEDLSEPL